jgi:hypothetical protein
VDPARLANEVSMEHPVPLVDLVSPERRVQQDLTAALVSMELQEHLAETDSMEHLD